MAKTAAKKQPSKELATSNGPDKAMVLVQNQVPAHIAGGGNRGNENVTSNDLVIPRLEIVQALSPAVKRGDAGYIEEAKPGMMMNSVTRQLYDGKLMVVPISYSMQYLVWRDRKLAEQKRMGSEGGFFGAYPTIEEAKDRAEAEGGEDKAIIVVDTPTHLCLVIDPDTGKAEEIMISMPRTKAKVSRNWNSMIRMGGGDRFSRVYAFDTVLQNSPKGDFYNFIIQNAGFPSKALYEQAIKTYESIKAGQRRVMDVGGLEPTGEGDEAEM